MLTAKTSRREMIRHFGSLTPEKVLGGSFPSMAKLRKEYGVEKMEQALAILIMDTSQSFNEIIPVEVAEDTAAEILTAYYYLTLEDCFVALKQLKKTKVFKFTANSVLIAFAEYDKSRQGLVDELSYNEHLASKETRKAPDSIKDVVKEQAAKQRELKKWNSPNKLIGNPFKKSKKP